MKHPYWSEIFYYFKEIEQFKNNLIEKNISPEILLTTRNSMVLRLNQLRNNLKQSLDEHSVYLIFFGLVSLLDEEMHAILSSNDHETWSSMQKHFFNLTNAGEVFFENLDEALENPKFPSIVFEMFYFILKKGFLGKYEKSPNRIAKYIEFLAEKIPESQVERKQKTIKPLIPLVNPKFKIWNYYAFGAIAVLCIYVGLNLYSNI